MLAEKLVGEQLAWALARGASKERKLLARGENLRVPDDGTGFFSSPAPVNPSNWQLCGLHSRLKGTVSYLLYEKINTSTNRKLIVFIHLAFMYSSGILEFVHVIYFVESVRREEV